MRESQLTGKIFIDWDIFTDGVIIFDDDNGYYACEISSAILEKGITVATNDDLAIYYSKDDLARFGLIEADTNETNKFELSMNDKTHIRFIVFG
ncbi:hypothetical protein M9Y10_030890 [Tritrichomonas musculus]|uniref:Uncharacterized protein n=1 Tax=Tritrichomonas musculus TaxID=1915356 RepID=A0ABR2H3B1_9EUKA